MTRQNILNGPLGYTQFLTFQFVLIVLDAGSDQALHFVILSLCCSGALPNGSAVAGVERGPR